MSVVIEISGAGQVVHDGLTSKKINSLLNSPKTRAEGLESLNSYLPQCADDDFIKYCVSWMHNCCKVDAFIKNRDYGIQLLGTLFQISSNYQELRKSVSFFITTRYFDYFLKYFLNSEVGWACTEICMAVYRGVCGPFQETLAKHLKNEVKKNEKISPTIARCFALMPSLGGVGNEKLNYWRNWKTQFTQFINVCHLILDDLFVNIEEFQEYESSKDLDWAVKENEKNPEYLTIQLYNYCNILNQMLLSQYPAPKAIPSDLVFQLICRALAINPKSLSKQVTTEFIALQKMLPEIQKIFLSLLKALIATCKNLLLPYAYLVCKLLRQSLEWTESELTHKFERPFEQVKISAYETLCNWLIATRSGGCVETISNVVITNATTDISLKKNIVVLKKSKLKMHHQGNRQVNIKANEKLCFAALKTLQFLFEFVGVLLKPEEHKFLQEFTVKLLVDIQKSSASDMAVPFSASKCRKELYFLLLKLVQHPCSTRPPPTHFALHLFRKGMADDCPQVSLISSSALSVITSLIHPQYNNEGFFASEASVTRREWTNQPMELAHVVGSDHEDHEDHENHENHEERLESDFEEEINDLDKLNSSLEKDPGENMAFVRKSEKNETLKKSPEVIKEYPSPKKRRMSSESNSKTPEKEGIVLEKEKLTPEKEQQTTVEKEFKKSEDSESMKIVTPKTNEEIKPKKTYFLRSKTKGSSEESEEAKSPDNLKNTPLRGLIKATPRRAKTRALSKVESESDTEPKGTKKNKEDEDDIIAAFDDSIIE